MRTTLPLKNAARSVRRSLVTANVVPSSPILVTLMIEALPSFETLVLTRVTRRNIREYGRENQALSSSEMSVLTRATRRNILEDTILHSHRRENLKSYILKLCFIQVNLLGGFFNTVLQNHEDNF
jgi:hypothetical protein